MRPQQEQQRKLHHQQRQLETKNKNNDNLSAGKLVKLELMWTVNSTKASDGRPRFPWFDLMSVKGRFVNS